MVQQIINGILLGGVYALVGVGMSMIFGIVQLTNLAHGEFVILSAYLSTVLCTGLGLHPLLTLIITSAVAAVTALSDRINLIDKDDARRIFLRLLKQVTHTRCSDTDEHLHKI